MFTDAMLDDAGQRAGNIATFIDDFTVDLIMTSDRNGTFLWPSKKIVDEKWGYFVTPMQLNAFLSHKSVDKAVAAQIRNYLNSSQVSVWFDEQEILPGMSIVNSISAGLERCQGCIALISHDFLESAAKWTSMELNYFLNMMGGGDNRYLIPVLLDISHK